MNIKIYVNASRINNINHLINLHKHITRIAKEYDGIRDETFVDVMKPLDDTVFFNENFVHVVVQLDPSNLLDVKLPSDDMKILENLELELLTLISEKLISIHEEIRELTIVSGKQTDGTYILPCTHIIYEVDDIDDEDCLSDLMDTFEILDEIIYEI